MTVLTSVKDVIWQPMNISTSGKNFVYQPKESGGAQYNESQLVVSIASSATNNVNEDDVDDDADDDVDDDADDDVDDDADDDVDDDADDDDVTFYD